MNIYFFPSQVERELLKTLWQHSLAQMAGILVDIATLCYYSIYLIYFIYLFIYFIYYFIYLLFISINCGYRLASTGAEVTNFRSIQYYTKTTIAR